MAVTLKRAKELVLSAWAGDEWWAGAPIATGVTDLGDSWLIEVGPRAYLVGGDWGSMMPDSPSALVAKSDGTIRKLGWIEAQRMYGKVKGLPAY